MYYVDGWPSFVPYEPIFGTAGSSPIWKWSGYMIHNAYAVLNPTKSSYEATYRVYIGDEDTGVPTSGYGAAVITFVFDATPVYTADFNGDGSVDDQDLLQWQGDFGANGDSDADTDGDSDLADLLVWQREFRSARLLGSQCARTVVHRIGHARSRPGGWTAVFGTEGNFEGTNFLAGDGSPKLISEVIDTFHALCTRDVGDIPQEY